MTAAVRRSVSLLVLCLAALTIACGDDSPSSPSQSSVIQGAVNLGVGQLAVVTFTATRAGIVNTRADWNNATNDIDTVLMRGRCTATQVLNESAGCTEGAAVAVDGSVNRPSLLAPSLQPGDYTFVIANWGPSSDSTSYRIEGGVAGGSAAATSPPQTQKTATFPFTLNGTTRNTVTVGPVNAGPGPISVTVDYAGTYNIQACVGGAGGCQPMGGTPGYTGTFNVPADFPAGNIQAQVYFNPNRSIVQPPGNPSGTVTFRFYAP